VRRRTGFWRFAAAKRRAFSPCASSPGGGGTCAALRPLREREGAASQQVRLAAEDGFKRLLSLAMETESRLALKERADREAIRVFAANLRELLLAPPLGGKNMLAIDPGFRTGCKAVCLDRRASCWRPASCTRTSRRSGARTRRPRGSATGASAIGSRRSRLATAPPGARPRRSCASRLARRGARGDGQRERRSIYSPPRSRGRSSPTRTSRCAARSPSAGG